LKLNRGYLIVFEGIDGTGKSTHCKLLEEYLLNLKIDVVRLFEPTKGEWGLKIRKILTEGRQGISPNDELELFIKDREDDVERNIMPALRENKVVLIDRYYFSTAAYQGALGLDPDSICTRNEEFAPIPDLVLLFHSSPEECLKRIEESRDGFSSFEKLDYLKKVQEIFNNFSRPEIKRINSDFPKDTVHENVVHEVKQLLPLE
jgi:dTMP kinase